MSAILSRLLRPARGLNWWWRLGLGAPLLAGLVIAIGAAVSYLGAGYEPPNQVTAGRVDEFGVLAPRLFEQEEYWLVRQPSGEFLALYARDPVSRCIVGWRPDYTFMGRTGWFRDSCRGSTYDLVGRCFAGPCPRGLDRFTIEIQDGKVVVNLKSPITGPAADSQATPVNPPP